MVDRGDLRAALVNHHRSNYHDNTNNHSILEGLSETPARRSPLRLSY